MELTSEQKLILAGHYLANCGHLRQLSCLLPGSEWVDLGGEKVRSMFYSMLDNPVDRGVWGISPNEDYLNRAKEFFLKRDDPAFYWAIGSYDGGQKFLFDHGFKLVVEMPIMYCDLTGKLQDSEGKIEVQKINTKGQLEQFLSLYSPLFSTSNKFAAKLLELWHLLQTRPSQKWVHHLGYRGGRPVSTASVHYYSGVAGIYDVGTSPKWQNMGLGDQMGKILLKQAQKKGYKYAVLAKVKAGPGLFEKLNFLPTGHSVLIYRFDLQRSVVSCDDAI